ncbi:head decoration protein [Gracilibacillus xinjiangensis]|uniref:Head decoration protein n=1 Tax=Gracilibacillus xinjiangensis TaxID=1193282 RepID=A0ABV8WUN5_9BACI
MPTLGTFEYDNLFAGDAQIVREAVTVKSGENLKRGTVIAKVSGEVVAVNSGAVEGTTPYGILADDVNATEASIPAVAYLTGEFNEAALSFGGEDTADSHRAKLREIGIFLKNNQGI